MHIAMMTEHIAIMTYGDMTRSLPEPAIWLDLLHDKYYFEGLRITCIGIADCGL